MKNIVIAPRFAKIDEIQRACANTDISDFLLKNGFLPHMIFPSTRLLTEKQEEKNAEKYLVHAKGLILQGGNDIDPSFYRQENIKSRDSLIYRDLFELTLVKLAVKKNIGILGICRGAQLINVAFGGSLYQDLDSDKWIKHISFSSKKPAKIKDIRHKVRLTPSGSLHKLFKKDQILVNSYHHQGIDQLGENLQVEAKSEDGLVEAISWREKKILGVQWHPELDFNNPNYRKIMLMWLHWINNVKIK